MLPNTSREVAHRVAERLRMAWRVQPAEWSEDQDAQPHTVSAGIATLGSDGVDLDTLLYSADRRLYKAKTEGRDRTISE